MVELLLDDNKTDRDGKENGKKNNLFILTDNNFASRCFVHFFAVVASLRHETA